MAVFREKGRQNNARVFLKDFERSKDLSYFISIGNSVTSPTASVNPSVDSIESDQYTWDNMFFMNQVFSTDVSLMIKKIEWVQNTRYEAFDKSKNQYELNEKFYAYNSLNNNVYLCLASPETETSYSTYPPTTETVDPEVKADGYIWKFLYKVSATDLEKFNYPGFLPIKTIGTELYTDERILQQNVQLNAVKGSIDAIDVVQQGSAYSDIVNNNFISNNYYASSVYVNPSNPDGTTSLDIIEITTDGRQISNVPNYYDGNRFVIHFSGGYTALIVSSLKGQSSENDSTLKLTVCNLFPDRFGLPSTSETYTILPYVKIIGNGSGAIAIPVFSADKRLTRISMLNIGSNYSYAEAQIAIPNGSILKPVFSLNGLGSDITEVLGSKHVLITKKITPITNLSESDPLVYSAPENIGVVYNGSQYKNVVSENTYYTQVALIKNPKVLDNNLVKIAGTEISEIREMIIEAIDPKIIITIGTSATPYANSNSFFEVDDIIVRGPDNYPDQFRAKIESVDVLGFRTVLTCALINGAFETYAGYRIKNLKNTTETGDDTLFVFQDCQNNCSNAISVQYLNTFVPQDFVTDDSVFGFTSLQTAEIVNRQAPYTYVNPLYPNKAKVRVVNPNTGFLPARYENGEYVPGEIVSGIKIVNGVSTFTKRGTLLSISEPIQIINAPSLAGCYILECVIDRDGIDTPFELVNSDDISLETNIIIRQGLDGAIGKVVRTGIPSGTGDTNIIYLYVNNYSGKFSENSESIIYQIDNLYNSTTSKSMKMTVQSIIYEPSLIKYSGNLLYINDAGPIQRRLENNENIKLLVEF